MRLEANCEYKMEFISLDIDESPAPGEEICLDIDLSEAVEIKQEAPEVVKDET
jgi:hypothetical protein